MKKNILIKKFSIFAMVLLSFVNSKGKSSSDSLKEKHDIYKIMHYASLAGSSHNSQPWKVEVFNNDSIVVFADTSRLLKVIDPKGIELFISIGAFIENLDIAAEAFGYKTEIILYENSLNPEKPVASIKLIKSGLNQQNDKLKDLELRTTLRIPFDKRSIINEDREQLQKIDAESIIFLSANTTEGQFVARKESEAYKIQAYQKDAQDELASWIRFSNKDVNLKRDGLTTAGMGIKGIGGFFVRNFLKPDDSKKESFVKKGIEKTEKQVENCGGWIIISTEKDNVIEWIKIGRLYESLNIQCRKLNLGFHPMNQIIEVPEIESEVNKVLVSGRKIRFVARIGYVKDYPEPVSKRRTVESFCIFR